MRLQRLHLFGLLHCCPSISHIHRLHCLQLVVPYKAGRQSKPHNSVLGRQVERLSGLIETPIEKLCDDGATAEAVRQDIINSSVNIDKRLTNLYDLIENDILGSLQYGCNYVAPYKVRKRPCPMICFCSPTQPVVAERYSKLHV